MFLREYAWPWSKYKYYTELALSSEAPRSNLIKSSYESEDPRQYKTAYYSGRTVTSSHGLWRNAQTQKSSSPSKRREGHDSKEERQYSVTAENIQADTTTESIKPPLVCGRIPWHSDDSLAPSSSFFLKDPLR